MDDGDNGAGRVTALELDGQWMSKKIALCVLFVHIQRIIKNRLKVWVP